MLTTDSQNISFIWETLYYTANWSVLANQLGCYLGAVCLPDTTFNNRNGYEGRFTVTAPSTIIGTPGKDDL